MYEEQHIITHFSPMVASDWNFRSGSYGVILSYYAIINYL